MRLTSIKIQKLFGIFDYNIKIDNTNDLTILTGPNGYGKTTILNIIYNLFNQHYFYFQKLNFKLISFELSDGKRIDITQKGKKEKIEQAIQSIDHQLKLFHNTVEMTDVQIDLYLEDKKIETFTYQSELDSRLALEVRRFYPFMNQMSSDLWIDDRTGRQIILNDFLNENSHHLPERIINIIKKQSSKYTQIQQALSEINVYLIKEQRLLRQTIIVEDRRKTIFSNKSFINTIEEYSNELKALIEQKQLEAYQITQQLDSSFPKRLIECKEFLSEEDFKNRFNLLTKKQDQLKTFGIATTKQDVTEYTNETKGVLTVYLEDSEKKVSVYDDLLNRIELFVDILNAKRFAFKSIIINGAHGFFFQLDSGQKLNLTDLSSGEQQEVVLLYELLFKTNPNTLILIDEPEISLHVLWQKAFIQDLQKIANVKQISFLVATHSPQIINDKWELIQDLFVLANVE